MSSWVSENRVKVQRSCSTSQTMVNKQKSCYICYYKLSSSSADTDHLSIINSLSDKCFGEVSCPGRCWFQQFKQANCSSDCHNFYSKTSSFGSCWWWPILFMMHVYVFNANDFIRKIKWLKTTKVSTHMAFSWLDPVGDIWAATFWWMCQSMHVTTNAVLSYWFGAF